MNHNSLLLLPLALALAARPAAAASVRFEFRDPLPAVYHVEAPERQSKSAQAPWIQARPAGNGPVVELGAQLVLQTQPGAGLPELGAEGSARVVRLVAPNVWLLDAGSAWNALAQASRLAGLPGVRVCHPLIRRNAQLPTAYTPTPNDPYYNNIWPLDQRGADGKVAGATFNVRAAWPVTRGAGVTIAVADTGIELTHPDLCDRTAGAPHHDFGNGTTGGMAPVGNIAFWAHGTEVAGLAAATLNNRIGMAGVAPEARLASWGVFQTNKLLASDLELMALYQHLSNDVAVQNHSWGHDGLLINPVSLLEDIGISNAVTFGRNGRGVVLVRSGGNDRQRGGSSDDDGYTADPRVVAVGAVLEDGRVTSYSEPGACLLVAAPGGDVSPHPKLFTTDFTGTNGVNPVLFPGDTNLSSYAFNDLGFSGTSAACPQISGVAALILSANSNLTARDVQHILVLSSRHFDLKDPDLATSGAGLRVSHNSGYGVPDAGRAVALACQWSNRPPAARVTVDLTGPEPVPDGGLTLAVTTTNDLPETRQALACLPGTGPFPDQPTALLQLVDVKAATSRITLNLTNKGALILRTNIDWVTQVARAATAGASFAVVRNNIAGDANCPGGESLCPLLRTDFIPIPCAFVRRSDGEALFSRLAADTNTLAQLSYSPLRWVFPVSQTLVCEHAGLRLRTDHALRGDLRVTLVSPMGTRSVLQRLNQDTNAGPADWTYYSTHHFLESSAGAWTLEVGDQFPQGTGSVLAASLILTGVPITDTDADGLDDAWETARLGSLAGGPRDDPDHDGLCNAIEQALGKNPAGPDSEPQPDFSRLFGTRWRLSWPSATNVAYEIRAQTNVAAPFTTMTNVAGAAFETEWIAPADSSPQRYYQLVPHNL